MVRDASARRDASGRRERSAQKLTLANHYCSNSESFDSSSDQRPSAAALVVAQSPLANLSSSSPRGGSRTRRRSRRRGTPRRVTTHHGPSSIHTIYRMNTYIVYEYTQYTPFVRSSVMTTNHASAHTPVPTTPRRAARFEIAFFSRSRGPIDECALVDESPRSRDPALEDKARVCTHDES